MARAVNKLTALSIAREKKPGRYGDGAGLYLVIDPNGSRRWIMIFRHDNRQREMGLGSATVFSLAEARAKRDEFRRLIAEGRDPIAEKRKPDPATVKAVTFGAFADQLIPEIVKGYRNEKHRAQWTSTVNTYAASLRLKPVADITTDDVLACLQPIWHDKNETAARVRGRIEKVLDAAKARGLRTGENPARWRGHLDQLLSKRRKLMRGHHAALPFLEVPAFVAELRKRSGVSALALEFTILTAGRVGEVLECPWSEIDRTKKVWSIPAARMKAERDHRVPLTPRMLEILDAMEPLRRGTYVFPTFKADKHMSNMAFNALLKRMGVKATTHGFRSSFRDWAGDATTFQREVAEAALSHVVGDATEAAYRRGDALEKRRELMNAWDAFVSSGTAA
ncbi:tyrosine-type recombinase/integrase [Methylobacterium sp. J-076]|uniref:tyrosine-type recombinase/integrase n=1 Tax=Methylobacterium sp. J-076 TaxID=2836655 RepID=UPI001FBB01B3|nr:site-specific integrase [Methylobacterium sp. J-076]MCJ2012165.1 integrase arm-type DNA-binding domain-containing protein [Methylobacterium sp. J-076]